MYIKLYQTNNKKRKQANMSFLERLAHDKYSHDYKDHPALVDCHNVLRNILPCDEFCFAGRYVIIERTKLDSNKYFFKRYENHTSLACPAKCPSLEVSIDKHCTENAWVLTGRELVPNMDSIFIRIFWELGAEMTKRVRIYPNFKIWTN